MRFRDFRGPAPQALSLAADSNSNDATDKTDRPATCPARYKPGTLQFWRDRLRKYARLAKPEPKPIEFADQVDRYLKQQDQRSLARVKAEKAEQQLRRLASRR